MKKKLSTTHKTKTIRISFDSYIYLVKEVAYRKSLGVDCTLKELFDSVIKHISNQSRLAHIDKLHSASAEKNNS